MDLILVGAIALLLYATKDDPRSPLAALSRTTTTPNATSSGAPSLSGIIQGAGSFFGQLIGAGTTLAQSGTSNEFDPNSTPDYTYEGSDYTAPDTFTPQGASGTGYTEFADPTTDAATNAYATDPSTELA